MIDTTLPDAGEPTSGIPSAGSEELHAHLLTAAKDDFIKRLDFLAVYVERWVGHPERRPQDMPPQQLRKEWQREGMILRTLVANIAKSGRSFAENVGQPLDAVVDQLTST